MRSANKHYLKKRTANSGQSYCPSMAEIEYIMCRVGGHRSTVRMKN